jgi:hypothetical protein
MLEVADILRRYGGEYLQKFGSSMPARHRRAFQDILHCRTLAMGGHVFSCDHCHHQVYSYHSCRNRSCPKCHGDDTENWLENRDKELLPVTYFHVVFTLPSELRSLVRSHPKILYGTLIKAAAKALIKLAVDPHYVGGRIGVLALLHTWTRTLLYHPHVHCLVPAGGVSDDQQWLPARQNYLVPVKALSRIFRGMFRDLVAQALPDVIIPEVVWNKEWVVYCKPTIQGAEKVLHYLGRYVHRVALANSRILSIDQDQVTFRYQKCGATSWNTMTLSGQEFIRRFLQHVLPKGIHKVRYYGLWNPSQRHLLHQVQVVLAHDEPTQTTPETNHLPDEEAPTLSAPEKKTCPQCGQGILVCIGHIPRPRRAPP